MNFRMVAPPKVEAEGERLLAEWYALSDEETPDLDEYIELHCSKSAKAYMRRCAAIHARLEPGEHV